jgi:hypothetical protein
MRGSRVFSEPAQRAKAMQEHMEAMVKGGAKPWILIAKKWADFCTSRGF